MKLLTCITFHYRYERLVFLRQVLYMQQFLATEVHVVIATNTNDQYELAEILSIAPAINQCFNVEIVSFCTLPHPWLLTWAHKVVLAGKMNDLTYTHFMCAEDDIEVTPVNVDYWLRAAKILRPFGLYPSFFRVEWNEQKNEWTSTDIANPISISMAPTLKLQSEVYNFINMPNPYQAMFFYDRELMDEHAASETFDIMRYGHIETIDLNMNWGGGGVAERANRALTFSNVPTGFTSRNVIPYFEKYKLLDPHCFVHHLPNNYANLIPELGEGKLPVKDVLVW